MLVDINRCDRVINLFSSITSNNPFGKRVATVTFRRVFPYLFMAAFHVPTLQERLDEIRSLLVSPEEVCEVVSHISK
jgi:hypothetical protein